MVYDDKGIVSAFGYVVDERDDDDEEVEEVIIDSFPPSNTFARSNTSIFHFGSTGTTSLISEDNETHVLEPFR